MLDTGMNIQESLDTLREQQKRLMAGQRSVQMFPMNTPELPLPAGMQRVELGRGVFHYNPNMITEERIRDLSQDGRENEFLELGPYSKADILQRIAAGDQPVVLVEYTLAGTEVRTALCCTSTVAEQEWYFLRTKTPGNIVVRAIPDRIKKVLGHAI